MTAICLVLLSLDVKASNSLQVEESFSKINTHIEGLYEDIRAGKNTKACNKALKAADLINDSIEGLRSIEPDYNWEEIRKVLLGVPPRYCE